MIEIMIGIILTPIALCAAAFTLALGVGVIKSIRKK